VRIACYAPLKPPDHPVPSGDRQIARSLLQALTVGGHEAFVASRFRSFDAKGDRNRQERLRGLGARIAERLVARWQSVEPPDLWFTYHVHHKAPDHLGPAVTRALGMPYVIAEASIARRQRDGAWSEGYADALAAIRAADAIVFLNPADIAGVRDARGDCAAPEPFTPFLDVAAFTRDMHVAPRASPDAPVRLITIAMMRERAKLPSYRMLAAALAGLRDLPWNLSIVGDGPARAEVAAAFADHPDRVRFLGAQPPAEVAHLLGRSDLFVWPAIDEAFGLVFLEAQACGVPVVGADSPGVSSVVAAGRTGLLPPLGDIDAFAAATRTLIVDRELRARMARHASAYVREQHDLPLAAARLDAIVRRAGAALRLRGHQRPAS
jgi:glycosyltransferase involved in cell wall biosynthesis